MATFKRFQDLEVWKRARILTGELYAASRLPGFRSDFALRNQLRRAGISVMLNIAEGCGRRTDKEFCYFLFVAIGSIAEIQSALYIALDQRYLDQQGFHQLMSMADEVGRMLSGLVKHLRRKPATA